MGSGLEQFWLFQFACIAFSSQKLLRKLGDWRVRLMREGTTIRLGKQKWAFYIIHQPGRVWEFRVTIGCGILFAHDCDRKGFFITAHWDDSL